MKEEPIIKCPVDETGKNSVNPSMTAKIIASIKFICFYFSSSLEDDLGLRIIEYIITKYPEMIRKGATVILVVLNNASPSNDFMQTLKQRMSVYYEHEINIFSQ